MIVSQPDPTQPNPTQPDPTQQSNPTQTQPSISIVMNPNVIQVDEPTDLQQQLGQLGRFLSLQQQKLEEQGNMIEQQAIFIGQLIPQLQSWQAQVETMQQNMQHLLEHRAKEVSPNASGAQSPVVVVQIHSPRATD